MLKEQTAAAEDCLCQFKHQQQLLKSQLADQRAELSLLQSERSQLRSELAEARAVLGEQQQGIASALEIVGGREKATDTAADAVGCGGSSYNKGVALAAGVERNHGAAAVCGKVTGSSRWEGEAASAKASGARLGDLRLSCIGSGHTACGAAEAVAAGRGEEGAGKPAATTERASWGLRHGGLHAASSSWMMLGTGRIAPELREGGSRGAEAGQTSAGGHTRVPAGGAGVARGVARGLYSGTTADTTAIREWQTAANQAASGSAPGGYGDADSVNAGAKASDKALWGPRISGAGESDVDHMKRGGLRVAWSS